MTSAKIVLVLSQLPSLPSLIIEVTSNEVFLNELRREKFSKAAESDMILSRSKGGGSFT